MKSLLVVPRQSAIIRLTMRSFAVSMLFVCLFLLANPGAHGQTTTNNIMNVDDTTSTPIPGAGHDYIHMLSETVNPANGSVSLRIELPVPKGRGITPSFSINYDSDSVQHVTGGASPGFGIWSSNGDTNSASNTSSPPGGWSFGIPSLYFSQWDVQKGSDPNYYTCTAYSNYMFMDLSGQLHALNIGTEFSLGGGICAADSTPQGGDTQVEAAFTDGPMNPLDPTSYPQLPVQVNTPDGTIYKFELSDKTALPSSVEDRNGNELSFTDNGSSPVVIYDSFTVNDTAGRPVIASSGGSTSETLTVGGLTYQIFWTTVSANASIPSQWAGYPGGPASAGESGDNCNGFPTSMQDTQQAISQINLPNGKSYHFHYGTDNTDPSFRNPYGLLNEIDYPSGAWVKYSWKLSDNFNEVTSFPGSTAFVENCTDPGPGCPNPSTTVFNPMPNGCMYQYDGPVIATRQVGFSAGGTGAQTQTFTYNTSWEGAPGTYGGIQWNSKTTNVVTTDNVRNKSATTHYAYSGYNLPSNDPLDSWTFPSETALEQETLYYDYSMSQPGPLLKTVDKTWANQYQPLTITTTPAGGSASTVTYQYIASNHYSLMAGKNEQDGVTGLSHTTSIAYQPFTGTLGDLVDRPCQVITCSSGTSCSSANRIAETDYLYDGGTSVCGAAGGASTSPVSGGALPTGTHDPLFGSGSTMPRGNVTEEVRYASSGSSPATTYTYDETGQIVSMTDPKNNTTQYSYSDSPSGATNSNAYLTKITYPTVNGITPIKSFSYDYTLGYLTQSKDENGQVTGLVTNYKYNTPPPGCSDGLDRLGEVDYPDGGQTTYCYNDAALTTTTTTLQTPNPSKTTVVMTDGVGHVIEKQVSDPYSSSGTDTVVTSYDGEGNVSMVSNPFQTTGDPTNGVTTYTYDALNRKKIQTNPDNTTESWAYNGYNVTFTNEDANVWTRDYDSFGNLLSVAEPSPGGTASYIYDTLNDLTGVTQGAESRSFGYDGLSRLLTATNPESGTTTYTYDADSNVLSRTDARGITTTYAYDVLNRLTGKTYSDATYPASYSYDVSSGPSPLNTIGRLTDEKTSVQGVTMTERAIDRYDAMGRVLSERQCFVGGCGAATNYTLTHQYDVAGNEVLSNNGLPGGNANAVTLGYSYDSAGHLQSVSSSLNDAEHPEVLFQATNYSAVGLTGASYALPSAEGTPAYNQALTYDTRLRLTGETDTPTSSTTNLPYSYTVGYDGVGNATGMTDSLMGTWTYTPDALNRLLTAVSSAGTYAGLTLTESYDVYGNRTNQVPSGSYGGPVPSAMLLTFNGNNNRADQWSYDAAGHVLNDGTNMYEYDAEGRQTGVYNTLTGLTGYVYNAEGNRVMKVVVNGFGTPHPTTTVEKEYLLGPNGEQVSVLDGSGNWQWTNVYAGGRQLATYDSTGTHFTLTDWLGTKRMQLGVTAASTVTVGEQCASLPYGDGLNCTGSDVNHLYFTGKERDTESGNDYFLARYYSSNMGGRFLTPDWSKNPQGVPYANYANPQSLNLYSYVNNNPLSLTDLDGHDGCTDTTNGPCELKEAAKKNSKAEQSKSQQQSAQGQAAQIPGAVKTAIMNSVNASNAPSGADTTGGFHEEGGIAGTNSSGGLVISPALPGTASHSGVVTESLTPADPTLAGSITDLTVSWHVHPSGGNASGDLAWVQPPSAQDQSVAAAEHQALPGLIHIVVGAGNRTVYFYNGNGYQQMSLKKFMGTQ